MMVINNKHNIGDKVYLVTDEYQNERFVISIVIMPNGLYQYNLNCGVIESGHYDFEISAEKDLTKVTP